jgi:hypothetical protein
MLAHGSEGHYLAATDRFAVAEQERAALAAEFDINPPRGSARTLAESDGAGEAERLPGDIAEQPLERVHIDSGELQRFHGRQPNRLIASTETGSGRSVNLPWFRSCP